MTYSKQYDSINFCDTFVRPVVIKSRSSYRANLREKAKNIALEMVV